MGDIVLKCVDEWYHVGHKLSNQAYIIDHNDIIVNLSARTNCLVRTFSSVGYLTKKELFKSLCCCYFGIELMDVYKPQFDIIQRKWRKCIRYTLNVHPWTHNDLLPGLIESPSIDYTIYSRILCFFNKGLKHECEYISFFFRNCLTGLHSYMSKNIFCITNRIGINVEDIFSKSEHWIKQICKPRIVENWQCKMIKELLLCRDRVLHCELSDDDINEFLSYLCTQ